MLKVFLKRFAFDQLFDQKTLMIHFTKELCQCLLLNFSYFREQVLYCTRKTPFSKVINNRKCTGIKHKKAENIMFFTKNQLFLQKVFKLSKSPCWERIKSWIFDDFADISEQSPHKYNVLPKDSETLAQNIQSANAVKLTPPLKL